MILPSGSRDLQDLIKQTQHIIHNISYHLADLKDCAIRRITNGVGPAGLERIDFQCIFLAYLHL